MRPTSSALCTSATTVRSPVASASRACCTRATGPVTECTIATPIVPMRTSAIAATTSALR